MDLNPQVVMFTTAGSQLKEPWLVEKLYIP
jgi:hypothetical protein